MLARIREPLSQLLPGEWQNSISFAAWPDDYLTGGALLSALVRRAATVEDGSTNPAAQNGYLNPTTVAGVHPE